MRLHAFALAAAAALALSAGTASAQYGSRGGQSHGGGYAQPAPSYGFGGSFSGQKFGGSVYGGSLYGGSRYSPGYGGFGGYTPAPRGHYDYVPGHYDPHRDHYHYHPGHFDYHRPGTRGQRH